MYSYLFHRLTINSKIPEYTPLMAGLHEVEFMNCGSMPLMMEINCVFDQVRGLRTKVIGTK